MLVGRIGILESRRSVNLPKPGIGQLESLEVKPIRAEWRDMRGQPVMPDLIIFHVPAIHGHCQKHQLNSVFPAKAGDFPDIFYRTFADFIFFSVYRRTLALITAEGLRRQSLRKTRELSKINIVPHPAPRPLAFQILHQLVRLRENIIVVPESLAPCYRNIVIVEKRKGRLDFQPCIPASPETVDLVIEFSFFQSIRLVIVYGVSLKHDDLRFLHLYRFLYRKIQIRDPYTARPEQEAIQSCLFSKNVRIDARKQMGIADKKHVYRDIVLLQPVIPVPFPLFVVISTVLDENPFILQYGYDTNRHGGKHRTSGQQGLERNGPRAFLFFPDTHTV